MEIKELVQQLWRISDDVDIIEKSVIYAFFKNASIDIEHSEYFSLYFDNLNSECCKKAVALMDSKNVENQFDIYLMIEIFGFIASFTSVISLIPQIIKSYQTKSVTDLSLLMLINFLICSISWTIYGILIEAISVWATNIIMTIFSFILLVFKLQYDK